MAYLLFTEGERLGRAGGVAVIGPNKSFLAYIRRVLPALGEVGVAQTTVEELLGSARTGPPDHPDTARLKGDARIGEVISSLQGSTRYDAGREALAQRLAHLVLAQMERRGAAPGLLTPTAELAVLDRGFRVPAQIIEYAARLLPQIAPKLSKPSSARRSPGALQVTATAPTELADELVQACRAGLKHDGSVGLIAADTDITAFVQRLRLEGLELTSLGCDSDELDAARLVCVPATLAKGLEFDTVVVVEPARIVAAEPRGLQRLYAVLTRAVSALHVVHAQPLPAALAGAAG